MASKKDKKVVVKTVEPVETHMQLFRRLAEVVIMHGTPGQRRPKGG